MAKKKKGFTGIIVAYSVVLLLLGVLLFLFWKGARPRQGLYETSVNFDNVLTELMVANGFSNGDITAQSRRDMKNGKREWIEVTRQVRRPQTFDEKKFLAALRRAAKKQHLAVTLTGNETQRTIEVGTRSMTLSRLVLLPAALATPAATSQTTGTPAKKVAIVIDDIGGRRDLSAFMDLGIPITFAIMPFEAHSRQIAQDLAERHMPFILHLPLEPEAYPEEDPGKAALLVKMDDDEIVRKFDTDLAAVPGVCGVSNHMGSRFSADEPRMHALLSEVNSRHLFYFDSYTTPKTKAAAVARGLHMPFLRNTIFLDVKDDHAFMVKQSDTLLRYVEKHGRAAAIAHIQKKNIIPVLKEMIPRYRQSGVEFVYLADLVNDNGSR